MRARPLHPGLPPSAAARFIYMFISSPRNLFKRPCLYFFSGYTELPPRRHSLSPGHALLAARRAQIVFFWGGGGRGCARLGKVDLGTFPASPPSPFASPKVLWRGAEIFFIGIYFPSPPIGDSETRRGERPGELRRDPANEGGGSGGRGVLGTVWLPPGDRWKAERRGGRLTCGLWAGGVGDGVNLQPVLGRVQGAGLPGRQDRSHGQRRGVVAGGGRRGGRQLGRGGSELQVQRPFHAGHGPRRAPPSAARTARIRAPSPRAESASIPHAPRFPPGAQARGRPQSSPGRRWGVRSASGMRASARRLLEEPPLRSKAKKALWGAKTPLSGRPPCPPAPGPPPRRAAAVDRAPPAPRAAAVTRSVKPE